MESKYAPVKIEKQPKAYCGPTVLMMLTGLPLADIRRDINLARRRKGKKSIKRMKRTGDKLIPWRLNNPVKGVSCTIMNEMLEKYGLKPERRFVQGKKQSLKNFAEDYSTVKKPVVIVVGNHYVLLNDGMVYDTYRIDGEKPDSHPYALSRVTEYWIIKREKPIELKPRPLPAERPPVASKPKRDIRLARFEKAKAQAAKWQAARKRAEKLEKKWMRKVRYYEKTLNKEVD